MGIGLLAAVIGGATLISVLCAMIIRAFSRRASRQSGSCDVLPAETRNAGMSVVKTVLIGIGCFFLVCIVLVIGWFIFIAWAFKDFTLF